MPDWTPGPWRAVIEETASFGPIGRWIVVHPGENYERTLVAECRTSHGKNSKKNESVANAHLIAAAPALYQALDRLMTELDLPEPSEELRETYPDFCSALYGATAALATARDEIPF